MTAASSPIFLRRSVLYAPAANARALEKLAGLRVDVVIVDLEDAVGPQDKDAARAAAAAFISRYAGVQARPFRELVVRVNALETPQGAEDLQAILPLGPDAILLPKIDSAGDIDRVSAAFDQLEARRGMALWAMLETPKAVVNLNEIASLGSRRRLSALVVGANDLGAALHMPAATRRNALRPILQQTVVAARAFGLAAIDSVYNTHQDVEGFAAEAAEARALGFDGKSLIHPRQIAPCHDAFAPTPAETDWARRVVAAFEAPEHWESGVMSVDGQMVERLHLQEARRILALIEDVAAADTAP